MTAVPFSGSIVAMLPLSHRGRAAPPTLLLALLCAASPAQGYTFSLDGKPVDLGFGSLHTRGGVVSLQGTPHSPAAGDLLWLLEKTTCLVRLAEAGHYEFFDDHGSVRLRRGDREQVAVLDSRHLVHADEATRRGLLGVVVDHWDATVAEAVAALDPTVPLVVTDRAAIGRKRRLPELPPAIHHLAVSYETSEGFGNLTAAAKLTSLRTLHLGGHYRGFTNVDLKPFANAVSLRAFACDQTGLTGAEVVAGFRELRSFAAIDFPFATFAWLQQATELRRLYCWGPDADEVAPRSLALLAELPHLEHLELKFTPIGELPAEGFGSLRTLHLQDTRLTAAQQRAFRKAHPACKIDGVVDGEQLQAVLATADRLVVRTGGTCHRDEASEKLLFETDAADEIAKVLPLLRIAEDTRDLHCMCCGSPTLVFFAGGNEIASLGVHHGRSIRWSQGPWNSDAMLRTGDGLAQWLAERGDAGPLRELRAAQARAGAGPRRAKLRAAVLGTTVAADADLEALGKQWLEQAAAAAATDAGATQLLLLGCHEGAWDAPDDFDRTLLAAAGESAANTTAWSDLIARCRADERMALGLATLWVADEGLRLPPERRAGALPIAASAALRSPQPHNRARMLQRLRDDPSDAALDVLVAALDGKFEPRQVRDEELVAPGGMRIVRADDPVLDAAGGSNAALAAVCLAARKHTASLPRIRELANKAASDADADLLLGAIARLEGVR